MPVYRLKIYETGSGAGVTYSNSFIIQNSSNLINVISPNSNEVIAGSDLFIEWQGICAGNFRVELLDVNYNFVSNIDEVSNSINNVFWTIPSDRIGIYIVKVLCKDNASIFGVSQPFTILPATNTLPTVDLLYPVSTTISAESLLKLQWQSLSPIEDVTYKVKIRDLTDNVITADYVTANSDSSYDYFNLKSGHSYRWVVQASKNGYQSSESIPAEFTVTNENGHKGISIISPQSNDIISSSSSSIGSL